ncbi:hypothetical protein [Desulfurivibrio sp. C05AmB]|uniref:hypothetical protein n=1 Tax=Desulfurivibrio sp. C05AmB TaxID=3374371 RepID=UPI00376EC9BC
MTDASRAVYTLRNSALKRNFFKLIWHSRPDTPFGLKHERTYAKRSPNGWLVRHMFVAGKKYTRSAIIYLSDSEGAWNPEPGEVKWERVAIESNPNFALITSRMEVPGGWLVSELLSTISSAPEAATADVSLAYVDDENHAWDIW